MLKNIKLIFIFFDMKAYGDHFNIFLIYYPLISKDMKILILITLKR